MSSFHSTIAFAGRNVVNLTVYLTLDTAEIEGLGAKERGR
jgi:hypothetical protein